MPRSRSRRSDYGSKSRLNRPVACAPTMSRTSSFYQPMTVERPIVSAPSTFQRHTSTRWMAKRLSPTSLQCTRIVWISNVYFADRSVGRASSVPKRNAQGHITQHALQLPACLQRSKKCPSLVKMGQSIKNRPLSLAAASTAPSVIRSWMAMPWKKTLAFSKPPKPSKREISARCSITKAKSLPEWWWKIGQTSECYSLTFFPTATDWRLSGNGCYFRIHPTTTYPRRPQMPSRCHPHKRQRIS